MTMATKEDVAHALMRAASALKPTLGLSDSVDLRAK
jgi:hypothetical protein